MPAPKSPQRCVISLEIGYVAPIKPSQWNDPGSDPESDLMRKRALILHADRLSPHVHRAIRIQLLDSPWR